MMIDTAPLPRASRVNAAAASDAGRVRTGNEDRHYVDPDRGVFLVVDGVGGHAAGEVAAAIAVDVISQRLDRPIGTPEQRVREAIALANNEILRQAERSPAHAGMTCVLTLALLVEDRLTIGHVGDSRLYKFTGEGLRKLTHDHSPVGEREDAQELTEAEAMVHPRRNEVFRDVGSTFREPDDPDFVELIEARFEPDAAILLCSDGLTDMIPSTVIEQTIRRHAGSPERIVEGLIAAANDAGGKDNITVVYAEGASMAQAIATPERATPIEPTRAEDSANLPRLTWLTIGVVAGLLAGLLLSPWLPFDLLTMSRRARTLVVGGAAGAQYPTIGAAVAAAAAGDVIQLEPGEYSEPIVLKDGVNLSARIPGSATLVAPSGYAGWVGVVANGRVGHRISGIRVAGRPGAPLAVALRLSGNNVVVDDVMIEGAVLVGIEVMNAGAIAVRSSQFADVQGLPMRIGPGAQPEIHQNVFLRKASADSRPAIDVADAALPQMTGNLFVGYANAVQGANGGARLLKDNFFIREPSNGR